MEIIYRRSKNMIEVKEGKKKTQYGAYGDVNTQCMNLFVSYFTNMIVKLCQERTNAMSRVDGFTGTSDKYLFFETVASSAGSALRQSTWRNYLYQVLKKMRENAPHSSSRYYANYILRLKELEDTFQKYVKPDKYYIENKDGLQLNLFNN
jgi:hypothetical protein